MKMTSYLKYNVNRKKYKSRNIDIVEANGIDIGARKLAQILDPKIGTDIDIDIDPKVYDDYVAV